MAQMREVMIVEDESLTRRLLAEAARESGFSVVAACPSAEAALEVLAKGCRPDLVLLDLQLPGMDGISALPLLRGALPQTEIVVQTVFEDPETILKAIRAGVSGYLLKGLSTAELGKALEDVLSGGSPLSPRVARKVLGAFTGRGRSSPMAQEALAGLTEREAQILDKLIQGYSYKDIGFELGIATNTVNSHLRRVYEKLRVNSRSEAVALATGNM